MVGTLVQFLLFIHQKKLAHSLGHTHQRFIMELLYTTACCKKNNIGIFKCYVLHELHPYPKTSLNQVRQQHISENTVDFIPPVLRV